MNKTTKISLVIILLSGLLGASPFLLEEYAVEDYRSSYNASVEFRNEKNDGNLTFGVDADRDMGFGSMITSSTVRKKLNITARRKAFFKLTTEGNFSEVSKHGKWYYFEGEKQMTVRVHSKKPGNYTGKVVLDFQLPKNQAGRYWLDLKYFYRTQVEDLKNKF